MQETLHPESHVPQYRERVDTGRQEVSFKSGCRGFSGLVPQPLCMKSKARRLERTETMVAEGRGRVKGDSEVH